MHVQTLTSLIQTLKLTKTLEDATSPRAPNNSIDKYLNLGISDWVPINNL